MQSTKYTICSIIEVTNQLGSLSVSSSNCNIQATAIDKALGRHQKHSLKNASALNYLKRKGNTALVDKNVIAATSKKRRVNCKVCRDCFKEPYDLYSTHRGYSSRCPHFTGLSFTQESSVTTFASTRSTPTDNKNELASNPKCPLDTIMEVSNDVENDKPLEFSSNIKSKANVDSSDYNLHTPMLTIMIPTTLVYLK